MKHFCLYLINLSTQTNTTKSKLVSGKSLIHPSAFSAYLADVHACITAQWLRWHQSIGANHSREQTSLINLLNGRAINKVDNTSFIHCNTCAGEKERATKWLFGGAREKDWEWEEKGEDRHAAERVRERSRVERGEGFGETSNSVRHSAQQEAVLSKAPHHRNVIIFPFQNPLKGLEQCNWRNKLFVTLDVSRVPRWTPDISGAKRVL